jgi:hypothetical protein
MEIPFDGILTLLIFLVGIPALVLQLISATERRAVLKNERLDVRAFLVKALWALGAGLFFEIGFALLSKFLDWDDEVSLLIGQGIWLIVFGVLFYFATQVAQQIPEEYGRREKIVAKLAEEVLRDAVSKMRVGGGAFTDLAHLGRHCEAGQEREMVVNALLDIVKKILANPAYKGDSFEALIDELVHMLASDPEPKDLGNYDIAIKILAAILSARIESDANSDRQRAIHAVSKLGQTLIVNFKSVERDNIILDYIDSLELALVKPEMLTEISQALFEIGVCAVKENHDFVFVAVLDKMTTLAGGRSPLQDEFITDLLGLLSHYWTQAGSRKQIAKNKFAEVGKFLPAPIHPTMERSKKHLVSTMYFDEADKLAQMADEIRRAAVKKKSKPKAKQKPRKKK